EGMPAHGVPFTAQIDAKGLLSWGMDPPHSEHLLPWQGPSWRYWITDRLAGALISANRTNAREVKPWQFALERLQLEGIDTTTWLPSASLWEQAKPEDRAIA